MTTGRQDHLAGLDHLHRENSPAARARAVDVAGPHDRRLYVTGDVRLQRHLLARDLRVRVRVAGEPDRIGLVDSVRVLEAERRDRRELDEALGAAGLGGVDHTPRPEHVHAPDRVEVAAEPHVGRGVDHEVAARDLLLPVARLRDVSGHHAQFGIGAHIDAPDLGAFGAVTVGQDAAYESKRARDENFRCHPGIEPGKAIHAWPARCRIGIE